MKSSYIITAFAILQFCSFMYAGCNELNSLDNKDNSDITIIDFDYSYAQEVEQHGAIIGYVIKIYGDDSMNLSDKVLQLNDGSRTIDYRNEIDLKLSSSTVASILDKAEEISFYKFKNKLPTKGPHEINYYEPAASATIGIRDKNTLEMKEVDVYLGVSPEHLPSGLIELIESIKSLKPSSNK